MTSVLRYRRSYEEQYDTWGLNLANYALYFLGDPAVDTYEFRNAAHVGHIKPRGKIGNFILRSYWVILYVAVLPLALFFWSVRTYLKSSRSFDEFIISYSDALRAVALLPQIYMFYAKTGRQLSEQLALMVFFEFINRWVAFIYWLSLPLFYEPKTMRMRTYNLVVQMANIGFLLNFGYCYMTEKAKNNRGLERVKLILLPVNRKS